MSEDFATLDAQLEELLKEYRERVGSKAVDEAVHAMMADRLAHFKSADLHADENGLALSAKHTVLGAYELVDEVTNGKGQIYDDEFDKHLPWMELTYNLIGAGGQAAVVEGAQILDKMDKPSWVRLLTPFAAWQLAEDDNKTNPEEAFKTLRRMPRTYLKQALEVLEDYSLGDLQEEGRNTLRGIKGLVRKDRDGEKARVAVKLVNPPNGKASRGFIERAKRELRMAGRVTDNSVVPIFYGSTRGKPYTITPLIKNPVPWYEVPKTLTLDEMLDAAIQVAKEIRDLSQLDVTHRDIKPANIVIQQTNKTVNKGFLFWKWKKTVPGVSAYLLDWGILKYNQGAKKSTELTAYFDRSFATLDRVILGTPDYMSPEQATDNQKIDTRSDLCSLGLTLYYWLSGRNPNHEVPDDRRQNIDDRLANSRNRDFRALMPSENKYVTLATAAMIQKNPDWRYQTPHEAVDDLEAVRDGKKPEHVYEMIAKINNSLRSKGEAPLSVEEYIRQSFKNAPYVGFEPKDAIKWALLGAGVAGLYGARYALKPVDDVWNAIGTFLKGALDKLF